MLLFVNLTEEQKKELTCHDCDWYSPEWCAKHQHDPTARKLCCDFMKQQLSDLFQE